jgi:hypothetical protein
MQRNGLKPFPVRSLLSMDVIPGSGGNFYIQFFNRLVPYTQRNIWKAQIKRTIKWFSESILVFLFIMNFH